MKLKVPNGRFLFLGRQIEKRAKKAVLSSEMKSKNITTEETIVMTPPDNVRL